MSKTHSDLWVRPRAEGQTLVDITPQSAGWQYIGFTVYRLSAGDTVALQSVPRERCIVVLSGIVTVRSGENLWRELGQRDSVFEDLPPYAVYLPGGSPAALAAHRTAEVAVASAPAGGDWIPPRLIEPAAMRRIVRGRGTNVRYVCDILPETEPAANLLLVEVRTPASHSSSYPPHKHDSDALPQESQLEEIYYHRIDPPSGFGFQRVYTDDRSINEAIAFENHDTVLVPRGYHPVVMPHGYQGYYLNVMAGPNRLWRIKNDPVHEWLLGS